MFAGAEMGNGGKFDFLEEIFQNSQCIGEAAVDYTRSISNPFMEDLKSGTTRSCWRFEERTSMSTIEVEAFLG